MLLLVQNGVTVVVSLPTYQSRDVANIPLKRPFVNHKIYM